MCNMCTLMRLTYPPRPRTAALAKAYSRTGTRDEESPGPADTYGARPQTAGEISGGSDPVAASNVADSVPCTPCQLARSRLVLMKSAPKVR